MCLSKKDKDFQIHETEKERKTLTGVKHNI